MSAIQMSIGYEYPTLELPCAFVDHYMARCAPVYALIYIHCLRQCAGGAASVSSQALSQTFQILETDVHNALRYWETADLIRLDRHRDGLTITFLPVDAPERAATPPALPIKSASRVHKNPGVMGVVKPFVPAGRPQYTVEELTVYRQQSKDIERLFALAEQALGKLLTYHDMNLLFGFYDWLRLPVDVIGYMLTYCADHEHRDMRYIEKVAMDWADKRIDDMEKALAYVQTFDRDYRAILAAMGAGTGFPTPSQRKYIDKWLGEYRMSVEMALEACDRAAAQIGKPKFSYVDKIMEDWHQKGILTKEAAEADAEAYARRKSEVPRATAEAKLPRGNRFVNFKQREYDYAQLEKLEREYLQQSLKR